MGQRRQWEKVCSLLADRHKCFSADVLLPALQAPCQESHQSCDYAVSLEVERCRRRMATPVSSNHYRVGTPRAN